jgi:hypothetical protein
MSWRAHAETIPGGNRYRLSDDRGPLSFGRLSELWSADQSFISWYTELLAGSHLLSFFWEHPAVSAGTLGKPAEFVLLEAPALTGLRADQTAFQQHFAVADGSVAVFTNLGGDATLVAPCAGHAAQHCAHLAPFLRNAPAELICEFWQTLGQTLLERIGSAPAWLSTSGLGVSWLHARLDSQPKYYQHQPYKTGR